MVQGKNPRRLSPQGRLAEMFGHLVSGCISSGEMDAAVAKSFIDHQVAYFHTLNSFEAEKLIQKATAILVQDRLPK
jgi:hypothetical protein